MSLQLVYPQRFLPRTRLIHYAEPEAEWTLCERSRVGSYAAHGAVGSIVGGVEMVMCKRCIRRAQTNSDASS